MTAIIVTYNRIELLKKSLQAVFDQLGDELSHVIVVNNASTDQTNKYLNAFKDERLIVENLGKNIGGAGGFNHGIRAFMEKTNDDYVWIMDDDTLPAENALNKLTSWMQKNSDIAGFVSSNVRWQRENGEPSWMNVVQPKKKYWSTMIHSESNAIEVLNSTFVSMLTTRKMIEEVGLPQTEYFIWGDDIEFTNRITRKTNGYVILDSIAVHASKENNFPGDVANENDVDRLWRYKYEFRNRIITAKRGDFSMLIKAVGHNALDFLKVIFKSHVSFRLKKLGMILRGTFSGIFFTAKIEFVKR